MPRKYDLTDKQFGNYKVIEECRSKSGHRAWKCKCLLCGNIRVVETAWLTSGNSKSCGCQSYKGKNNSIYRHGLTNHKLYKMWGDIKTRCYNQKSRAYKYYGGKGITMCDEWKNDFVKFYEWALDNGYEEGLSIERRDNSKNYCPDNCTFITFADQQRHKTNSLMIEYQNETHCLAVWCHRFNLDYDRTRKRILNNWTPEEAFNAERFELKHI